MVDSLSIQKELELGRIYEPEAVILTYDSPGWYVLFTVIAIVILLMVILIVRWYLKNAYRRNALKMLHRIQLKFDNKPDFECINEAMVIVKHTAIQTYGRDEVATLSGVEWLSFLDEKYKRGAFIPLKSIIHGALYENKVSDTEQAKQLFIVIQKWINKHA